jgi:hypothetical protein
MAAQNLIGGWSLVDYRVILGNDQHTILPFGSNPQGILTYTSDGFMSANMMKPGAKPHENSSPHGGTMEENANSLQHTWAYAGTYTIGDNSGYPDRLVVEHSVQVSSHPNWVGTVQSRLATFTEDKLVLESLNLEVIEVFRH